MARHSCLARVGAGVVLGGAEGAAVDAQKQIIRDEDERGKVLKVVREDYLRDDIYCGSSGCKVCDSSVARLSSTASTLVIVDTNVVLNQAVPKVNLARETYALSESTTAAAEAFLLGGVVGPVMLPPPFPFMGAAEGRPEECMLCKSFEAIGCIRGEVKLVIALGEGYLKGMFFC